MGDVPVGLHKEEISRLPVRRYSPDQTQSAENKCQICLNEWTTRSILKSLPCFHEFCTSCIDKWLKVRNVSLLNCVLNYCL